MPSGAKKRKAAKKKLLKEAHYKSTATNFDGSQSLSHSLGNDNAKSHVERKSDGGEVERESSEERALNDHAEVKEEMNFTDFAKKEKLKGSCNDISVNSEDDFRETKNGVLKKSSLSSSSSSSDDDQVAVQKENPVVEEAGAEKQVLSSLPKASRENPVISEVVYNSVEESILVDESNAENEGEFKNSSIISNVAELEMKQTLDEVVPSVNEEVKVSPEMTDFVEEKIETKVIQVVDEDSSEKLSQFVNMTVKDGGSSLSQSSGITSADASCGDNQVKESETHKYVEDQPFISSAPLPVRRTSWTSCCGLFEVFSGGASR